MTSDTQPRNKLTITDVIGVSLQGLGFSRTLEGKKFDHYRAYQAFFTHVGLKAVIEPFHALVIEGSGPSTSGMSKRFSFYTVNRLVCQKFFIAYESLVMSKNNKKKKKKTDF